ncbi:hypothetical protein J437_LFUL000255 [Ladona fulva]|uniref:Uncharacterized protein n=1 Tax=Ladona fulva TaxID=123851 RepID=A0A8K0JW43_LADFU|nr:hypothetical protein J437_LFUL000255 [Ladona fulva]
MEIKAIRKTNDGGVLLQLGHKTKNKRKFGNLIPKVLSPNHIVHDLKPRMTLEIRDLDCTTTEAEVRDAISREMEEPLKDDFKVAVFEPNNRGQKMAVAEMEDQGAISILNKDWIKIRWVYG